MKIEIFKLENHPYHLICFSDFVEMFIHHITTILLMGLSWTCNLTRVGTLVLVIHDVADILLEVSDLICNCVLENWKYDRMSFPKLIKV